MKALKCKLFIQFRAQEPKHNYTEGARAGAFPPSTAVVGMMATAPVCHSNPCFSGHGRLYELLVMTSPHNRIWEDTVIRNLKDGSQPRQQPTELRICNL